MISFIIIGKDESKTISLTIESIKEYINYNSINNHEIIYVDSRSSDNSIDIVKKFEEVIIVTVLGELNAAIARNIGAEIAKGDIFIFLDGDMEIEKEFHDCIFEKNELVYPFISGQLYNIFYNQNWKEIDHNYLFPNLNKDIYSVTTGGYFIIEAKLWFLEKGMNTKFKRAEDLDLGLRLAKRGIPLFRKKNLFVKHHTIDYQNKSKIWKMLFNGSYLYSTSLLYREHLFNACIYKGLIRKESSFIILILSLFLTFVTPMSIIIYFFALSTRVFLQRKVKGNSNVISRFVFLAIKDIMTLFGFFSFFPKKKLLKYKIDKYL